MESRGNIFLRIASYKIIDGNSEKLPQKNFAFQMTKLAFRFFLFDTFPNEEKVSIFY